MTIYRRHLAFSAAPKTGTTYVTTTLAPIMGLGSGESAKHEAHDLAVFSGFRITLVRNPASWLESCYAWLVNENWRPFPGAASVLTAFRAGSVDEFVDGVCSVPRIVGAIFSTYTRLATDVFRSENLSEQLPRWLEEHDYKCQPLPVVNRTDPAKRPSLSIEVRDKITKTEREFIQTWYGGSLLQGLEP